ncbi:MAG: homoserine O-succinyltransferase [Candidatus Acidiferrum sp.]
MPLVLNRRDFPIRLEGRGPLYPGATNENPASKATALKVALVNNMPDAALEDTEAQFVELLSAAASNVNVELSCYSLPKVPRDERARRYLDHCYFGLSDLLSDRFDGVIVTGTEPHHSDLRDEPYWDELRQVLDWAEECTSSAVLSCLAAHAGVFHSDGILRQRLQFKRFGVFSEEKVVDNALTCSVGPPICFPHSRWSDLRPEDLYDSGYNILTRSAEAGVGLFVKKKKNSLFVHFQGHPEYGERTLMKEYRRDVRRFLRKERETYPSLPQGYFDKRAEVLLGTFEAEALGNPREDTLEHFPEACVVETLEKTWHGSSVLIYRNWLKYVTSEKVQTDYNNVSFYSTRR